jgi:UDP-glucose 4-epimerase
VGRELVRQLAAEGSARDIHVIDNLACGEARLETMDQSKFVLHRCDIRDSAKVGEILHRIKPDIVFHLAAVHFIPACEAKPGSANSINVSGTVNLLHAVAPGTMFVLASTAAVYRPDDAPHLERDDMLGPMDVYGYTKLHAENFVRYYHGQKKVRATIVRLFNVVGPGKLIRIWSRPSWSYSQSAKPSLHWATCFRIATTST